VEALRTDVLPVLAGCCTAPPLKRWQSAHRPPTVVFVKPFNGWLDVVQHRFVGFVVAPQACAVSPLRRGLILRIRLVRYLTLKMLLCRLLTTKPQLPD